MDPVLIGHHWRPKIDVYDLNLKGCQLYYICNMRFWVLRALFLLISANVAYGTHGDIYADKVQELINPLEAHISFSPDINMDLFAAQKNKGSERSDKLLKTFHKLSQRETTCLTIELIKSDDTLRYSDNTAAIHSQVVRRLIYPHHCFS